jgi:ectoine hydroxylase-related dioxygenase (phytanoyl-CoA dioxygenase family)
MPALHHTCAAIQEGLITETDLESYHEKGYWISPKLFDDDSIELMRREFDRIWSGANDGDGFLSKPQQQKIPADPLAVRKIDSAWWINDRVLKMATEPALGKIAAVLMNTQEVRLWHDQIVLKPGQGPQGQSEAGNIGWHQDYSYWKCSSATQMCTAWIALQDTDEQNGGMFSVVGSHKWGLIEQDEAFYDTDMEKLKKQFTPAGKQWIEEPCRLKKGHVSFHHSLCFHGSGANLTSAPRLAVIAHLLPAEARYLGPVQRHTEINFYPRPKKGEKFRDEFHPLLWREA